MSVVNITAKKRDAFGSRNVKQLRQNGLVPGVFYKEGSEATHVVFDEKSLSHFLNHAHGLVDLDLEGEKAALKCVLKEVQYHPVTESVLHVDFLGVNMDKEMQIEVPVLLKGDPRGVKLGGFLQQPLRELTIECLPGNLPDQIEIDVSQLEIGDSIHVKDLQMENIRILNDPSDAVALVEMARIARVVSEAEEEAEELEESEEETTEETE